MTYDEIGRVRNEKNPRMNINKSYYYDNNGYLQNSSYTQDAFGNIKTIGDKQLTYTRGNRLTNYNNAVYYYNHQGVRFKKVVNGLTTNYITDGGKILSENRVGTGWNMLYYYYDATGVCGVNYEGNNYKFIKNAQGSVVKIIHAVKEYLAAEYEYDAFGNCRTTIYDAYGNLFYGPSTDSQIGMVNPFRWKGHYLDAETIDSKLIQTGVYNISGMYYINGRYYSTKLGGFVDCSVKNPSRILPNYANIFTSIQLVAADPSIIEAYYTSMHLPVDPNNPNGDKNGLPDWLNNVFNWYNDLHWGWKVGIGIGVIGGLAAATVITGGIAGVAAGGTFWASGAAALGAGFTGAAVAGSGALAATATITGAAFAGASIAGVSGFVFGGLERGGRWDWNGAVNGFALGSITGAISGGVGSLLNGVGNWFTQGIINGALNLVLNTSQDLLEGKDINWDNSLFAFGFGFLGGALGTWHFRNTRVEALRHTILGVFLGVGEDGLSWLLFG